VVSRKAALEEEINARKTTLLEHLHEGDIVTGVVKNLTDYAPSSNSVASTACSTSAT